MVTKGIITSIDFNGNTCQVRIPLFESAGNDPITGTAIVSNTPGSYNGYKVGDVVLVAFEDGKMQNPVIVGKLYLGAAKEKQDPRGTINVETTTASKSASLPADAVLTANVDSNVPNTNTPFGSLASIANNLNSLNTDVNQLDRFTRNQFNSVITDVNDQGEQLRSEIKQTAENIEANVVHKHQDGSQKTLGWNLDEKEWKINAQDTINGEVKDINIVTIDRGGMSIAGDLKLNGYPKNIIVRYAQNDSDATYPDLYSFKEALFPITSIDKTWYYGKYIKITDAGKEKYVLISKENFEQYTITVGTTIAYNREISSKWSTEVPKRVDGKYIWQWTRTEAYSFDKNNDVWIEKDDDRIVCITGARGETGTSVSECKTYYSLSNLSGGPEANDDNIASTPKVNKWSTSPQAFDKTLHQNYIYWTVERRVYTDPAKIVWGTPVKASMLSVDFIDSLGITANKITVLQDNTADPSDSNKILFEADGLSGEGIVKIGDFKVQNKDLVVQQSSEDDIVPLVPWLGKPLNNKTIWNTTYSTLENTFTVSETISGWEVKYIYYEYNEDAPAAFDATGTPTEEQIKNRLTLYLVLAINDQTTQEYKFKTTIKDYSIWEQKEINTTTQQYPFIATQIPVDISNSGLATTRVSPEELFIGYEKKVNTSYESDYWFTITPEMLKDSSIDIDSLKDSQLYEAIFKKPDASDNGTPWSTLKFNLNGEDPSICILNSKLTLKLGHLITTSGYIHSNTSIDKPSIKPGFEIMPNSHSITPDLSLEGGDGTGGESVDGGSTDGEASSKISSNQRIIYQYFNITQVDPNNDEITWQSTSGLSIKTRYLFPYKLTINNNTTYVNIPLVVKVPNKNSYVKAGSNGALTANNATISGNLNAEAGKVGCFDIYETGLYSDFIELSENSLVLTGGKFTLSSSNTGESISLDTTSNSNLSIIFSGNGSIVDQTGSVGLRFKAGESENQIEYKAFLYAAGTDGFGGTNSITITIKSKDSSGAWNTGTLKKDITFTIYHEGYDMGYKIRQLTITLKAGEYTKTVEFSGYWAFYGASWTSDGVFEKNREVEGPKFTQAEVVSASLYALSSILPQSTGTASGTISVYYNTSYGPPVNAYEYEGTQVVDGNTYYKWSGNHGNTGHPTVYYTRKTPAAIKEMASSGSSSELHSTTLYYMNSNGTLSDNSSNTSNMYISFANIIVTTGCSLGSETTKWDAVYATTLYGTVNNSASDLRLKQNINYDISKYDNLFDSLKPASYQFKSDLNPKTHLGFIAQEIEQSLFNNNLTRKDFAGVTIYGEGFDEKTDTILNLDKTTYALGYNELHALEVRQIQLLKARVQELETKIEQLIKNKE